MLHIINEDTFVVEDFELFLIIVLKIDIELKKLLYL